MCFYRCLAYHIYTEKRRHCQAEPKKISKEINAIAVRMADSVDAAHRADNVGEPHRCWEYRSVDLDEVTTIPAGANPDDYPALGLQEFSAWLEIHFKLNILGVRRI
jgi:uncharacterized protein YcaQ